MTAGVPGRRKFILDTHVFIAAFRDPAANDALQAFHRALAPFEYLSAVVAQELRAGIRRSQDRRNLERHVLGVYGRAGRVVTPTAESWHQSGDILSKMASTEGVELTKVPKSFGNDLLIALSCREAGCVLVTDNTRDFRRIRRFVRFEFVEPWSDLRVPS